MPLIDATLLAGLRQQGLLREGHFAFRSGRHSAGLLDRDLLLADPQIASRMGYSLAKRFFTDHIDTVAAPSIWGAGLAQWVGYFLEPRAKVVYATREKDGTLAIAEHLIDQIAGKRVLLIDNLVMTGDTMHRFAETIDQLGATVLGIGTLWNAAEPQIQSHPVTGLLNAVYEAFPTGHCPICAAGAAPAEEIPY
jgi:orotate phosphoribosyltransferase